MVHNIGRVKSPYEGHISVTPIPNCRSHNLPSSQAHYIPIYEVISFNKCYFKKYNYHPLSPPRQEPKRISRRNKWPQIPGLNLRYGQCSELDGKGTLEQRALGIDAWIVWESERKMCASLLTLFNCWPHWVSANSFHSKLQSIFRIGRQRVITKFWRPSHSIMPMLSTIPWPKARLIFESMRN